MWESQYAKEPVDLRLLALRLWKQAGKLISLTCLGVLLFGGGYCLKEFVLTPPRYAATSLYQVEYALDPQVGSEYTYINGTTWNRWMGTKEFLDLLYRNLEGTPEARIDRETMKGYLSARLQMDLRMPDTTVTTSNPELSLKLASAVERSMVDFASVQKGIDNIRVVDPACSAPYYTEARPLNACVLSAVATFFVAAVLLCIKELGDDSIWLPATLRKRYGLKAAGTTESKALAENLRYLLGSGKTAGVLPIGADAVPEEVMGRLREAVGEQVSLEAIPCAEKHPQIGGHIRELDGLVLAVEAGARMGRRLEAVLDFLELQDCGVTAAVLVHADERLIRRYYWRERLWKRCENGRKENGQQDGRSGAGSVRGKRREADK